MTGVLRLATEILARPHQPRAEEPFPQAVDPHAGGEGVVTRGDPACQRQPIDGAVAGWTGEECGERRVDRLGGLVVFAAREKVRLPPRPLHHHHGAGQRLGELVERLPRRIAGRHRPAERAVDRVAVEGGHRLLLRRGALPAGHRQRPPHRRWQLQAGRTDEAGVERGEGEAEATDRMPVESLLADRHPHGSPRRCRDGCRGEHRQAPRHAALGIVAVDGPAAVGRRREHLRGRPARLLVVGLRAYQGHRFRRGAAGRHDRHLHVRDDDVAVAGPAEATAAAKRRVGKDLEAHAGECRGGRRQGELVGVTGREGALDVPRPVVRPAERGPSRRTRGDGIDRDPGLTRRGQHRPHRLLPGSGPLRQQRLLGGQRPLGGGEILFHPAPFEHLAGAREALQGVGIAAAAVGRPHDRAVLGHVVEDGEQGVEVALRERVVFVVVAPGTAHREPEPGLPRGLHPIDHRLHPPLLGDDPALAVDAVIAVEPGRHALLGRRPRQHVAGELLDGEPVEGEVAVVGVDHPVAPRPVGAAGVGLVAVAVGIARGIEPLQRHPFAEVRAGQQRVDVALHRPLIPIGDERRHRIGLRREAGEVEGQSPRERVAIGLGIGREPHLRQRRTDEPIDGGPAPTVVGRCRQRRSLHAFERPVPGKGRARRDPLPEPLRLGRRHRLGDVGRGHHHVGVGTRDPRDQGAGTGFSRHDGRGPAGQGGGGARSVVEPQPRLALASIGTVAGEAAVGEERADVAVEIDRSGRAGRPQPEGAGEGHPAGQPRRARFPSSPLSVHRILRRMAGCGQTA